MSRVAAMIILGAMLMPREWNTAPREQPLGLLWVQLQPGCDGFLLLSVEKKKTAHFRKHPPVCTHAYGVCFSAPGSRIFAYCVRLHPMAHDADDRYQLSAARMLAAGFSRDAVREAVGYFGMALSLMHFPNVFTYALIRDAGPSLADASALHSYHQVQHRVNEAVRITVMLGLPHPPVCWCWQTKPAFLLFGYAEAGEPLKILALGTLPWACFKSAPESCRVWA